MPQKIQFALDEAICKLGKYSNNLEKHGEKEVSCWAVPFTNVMLSYEQYNLLVADPHGDRAIFNQRKEVYEPTPWLRVVRLDFRETFEEVEASIAFSDKLVEEFVGCRVKILELRPLTTRVVATDLQIQLYPNRKQLVLIHEHQHHEVRLSISNAKVAEKKRSTQQELELPEQPKSAVVLDGYNLVTPPNDSGATSSESSTEEAMTEEAAAAPPEDDTEKFEEGVAKALGAHKKRGSVIDGRSERVKHADSRRGKH